MDASNNEPKQCGGRGGWILRDSSGSPICMRYKKIKKNWSVKTLEIKAIHEGLRSLHSLRANYPDLTSSSIIVESDAAGVVDLFNKVDEDFTKNSFLAEEINQLIESLGDISFDFCPRSRNVAAHRLTRIASSASLFCFHLVLVSLLIQKKTMGFGLGPQIG